MCGGQPNEAINTRSAILKSQPHPQRHPEEQPKGASRRMGRTRVCLGGATLLTRQPLPEQPR